MIPLYLFVIAYVLIGIICAIVGLWDEPLDQHEDIVIGITFILVAIAWLPLGLVRVLSFVTCLIGKIFKRIVDK